MRLAGPAPEPGIDPSEVFASVDEALDPEGGMPRLQALVDQAVRRLDLAAASHAVLLMEAAFEKIPLMKYLVFEAGHDDGEDRRDRWGDPPTRLRAEGFIPIESVPESARWRHGWKDARVETLLNGDSFPEFSLDGVERMSRAELRKFPLARIQARRKTVMDAMAGLWGSGSLDKAVKVLNVRPELTAEAGLRVERGDAASIARQFGLPELAAAMESRRIAQAAGPGSPTLAKPLRV